MTTSAPPTPPSRPPMVRDGRFKTMTTPCEWIEDYYPGNYHPVHLGDVFCDGQYKVIRKLGDGAYSTVWLAHDNKRVRYVAIKIIVSAISTPAPEAKLQRHLSQLAPTETARFVTQLLDEFVHKGPNGTHRCLVFEPMGPNVSSMVEELPQFKPRIWGMKIRYPPAVAKSILKQSLEGLQFLHKNHIAHGDFHPGNILFALRNIDAQPEHLLLQRAGDGSVSEAVQRRDGKSDRWAPRYLCVAQPLSQFVKPDAKSLRVKLSDLGGAYFFSHPPKKILTPLGLRPPELIFDNECNQTLDIWSFGCLVYELITGRPLFCVPGFDFEDDDHILALIAQLGPLPVHFFRAWKNSSLYFDPDGKLYNCQLGGVVKGAEPLMLDQLTMEQEFDDAKPEIDDVEAAQIKALIRRILQYDPAKRPSATEILSDPWFQTNTKGKAEKESTL